MIKKAQEAREHQSNAVEMEEGELGQLADKYANLVVEGEDRNAEPSKTITFYIDDVIYTAVDGMTWREWVESDYNTGGFVMVGVPPRVVVYDPSYGDPDIDLGLEVPDDEPEPMNYFTESGFVTGE